MLYGVFVTYPTNDFCPICFLTNLPFKAYLKNCVLKFIFPNSCINLQEHLNDYYSLTLLMHYMEISLCYIQQNTKRQHKYLPEWKLWLPQQQLQPPPQPAGLQHPALLRRQWWG